jgi:hypothetical protein
MKRWVVIIGTALVAATVAPVALADTPADAHNRQAAIAGAIGDSHDRVVTLQAQAGGTRVRDSHDRAGLPPVSSTAVLVRDAHERSDGLTQQRTVLVGSGGFDWGDAAIGAVSGMGIALLLAGLGFLTIGQRTRTRPVLR